MESTPDDSDLNLVKRARNGDEAAFRDLMLRHQRRIFQLCFGMVRNPDDARDLTQETFVKVYRNLDKFEGNSAFYTWAYRIARNVTIDHLRRARRHRSVEYNDAIGRDDDESIDDTFLSRPLNLNPARVVSRRELLDKINEAALSLSEIHREVITLREVEGLSYQEIADRLEISIGTVMSRLHHARRRMQEYLLPYLEEGS